VVALLLVALQVAEGFEDFPNVELAFLTVGPLLAGQELRRRQRLVEALDERARQIEDEEQAFVALFVQRERARVARELHDIVAHNLAVIVVQAGAGRLAAPGEDDAVAHGRMETIRGAAEQALGEMGRLVDVIHADAGSRADALRAVVAQAESAGLTVDLVLRPDDDAVRAVLGDDGVQIVREGLTNAIKHAPGSRVDVRLVRLADGLDIDIRDRGAAETDSIVAGLGARAGLRGVRERVEMAGGWLQVGPDGSGWRLRAWLPTGVTATADTPAG
jgi:signal transduction histidine kinase